MRSPIGLDDSPPPLGLRRRIGRAVTVLAWVNLTALLAIWFAVLAAGTSWWPVTIFIYAPRSIWGLPTLLVVPIALFTRPRALVPLALATIVVIVPIMGFRSPEFGLLSPRSTPDPVQVRVLTCNLGDTALDVRGMAALVRDEAVDVALLQEARLSSEASATIFPESEGWRVNDGGDWLGLKLIVAAKYPVRNLGFLDGVAMDAPGLAASYDLEIRGSLVRFVNVLMPSSRQGFVAIKQRRFKGLGELSDAVAAQLRGAKAVREWIGHGDISLIVAGDFNITDDDPVYRVAWKGFDNAFATAGRGFGHTKVGRWFGWRIDHILAGPGWKAEWCRVGPEIGTDHRPVIASLRWTGPSEVFPHRSDGPAH